MNKTIEGINDLCTVAPDLLSEWNYERNGEVTPNTVSAHSSKQIWWKCKKGHEWKATPKNRMRHSSGCPYCSGRYPIVGTTDLQSNYPKLSKEWNYKKNYPLTPKDVTCSSGRKVWWIGKCGHEWQATISNRTKCNSSCPICSNRVLLRGYNDLFTKKQDLIKDWDYTKNSNISPKHIIYKSSKKVW